MITLQATDASWDALTLDALIVGMVEILLRMGQASVIRWYYGRIRPNPQLMRMHMIEEYAEMAAEYIAISIAILYQVYFSESFQVAVLSSFFMEIAVDLICISGLQALAYPIDLMLSSVRDRAFLRWNYSMFTLLLLGCILDLGESFGA